MKKILLILCLVSLGLMSCTNSKKASETSEKKSEVQTTVAESSTEIETTESDNEGLVGNWNIYVNEKECEFPDGVEKEIFEKGIIGCFGEELKPIACLGLKLDNGNVNYMYLCLENPVVPLNNSDKSLCLVNIYKGMLMENNWVTEMQKGVRISVSEFYEYFTKTNENERCTTGNSFIENIEDDFLLESLNKLVISRSGEYKFCSVLATQVVAGTNYLVLAHNTKDDVKSYRLLTVYSGVDGVIEITGEETLSPASLFE